MTREEAIICLKGIKNYGRDTFNEQSDWQGCLDMAIKALEQEPCEDTISRQAAIDVVKGIDRSFVKYIEELPSAQPEIIRCKDCKWKQGAECVRFADVRPFPSDFCSRAERRTDE